MPITSLDGVISGALPPIWFAKGVTPTLVAGKPQSLWGLAGNPGAGGYDNTLAGAALSSSSSMVDGQIPYTDPVNDSYLAQFQGQVTQPGMLLLCDRLWHNGGFTITSNGSQTVNSVAFPARDNNGSSNGEGVILGLEISAAAGAASPTITVGYTNSANTAGRTAVNSFPTANSPAAGSFFPIGLQSGDRGVRSVQSLQLSASWLSGTMRLVAYRVISALEITGNNIANSVDAVTGGFPKLFNGTVPFLIFIPSTTTASYVSGRVVYTQD